MSASLNYLYNSNGLETRQTDICRTVPSCIRSKSTPTLHNADRSKADGTRNKEVDKAHTAVLAAQRLLHDIVAEIDEYMGDPIEGTTAKVAEASANAH